MTIYYIPAYSTRPCRKNSIDVGNIYCGSIQLLSRLIFYFFVNYEQKMPPSDGISLFGGELFSPPNSIIYNLLGY